MQQKVAESLWWRTWFSFAIIFQPTWMLSLFIIPHPLKAKWVQVQGPACIKTKTNFKSWKIELDCTSQSSMWQPATTSTLWKKSFFCDPKKSQEWLWWQFKDEDPTLGKGGGDLPKIRYKLLLIFQRTTSIFIFLHHQKTFIQISNRTVT